MSDISARIDRALMESSPIDALATVAKEVKSEGMSQRDMYYLFDGYRDRHQTDKDETRYNAILDVMDLITGWCSPQNRLFESEFRI